MVSHVPDLDALMKAARSLLAMDETAVLKELGYSSAADITESPWACWQKLIA